MENTQDMVQKIARAVVEENPAMEYKSVQDLVRTIVNCIEVDDDGNPFIRVQPVE